MQQLKDLCLGGQFYQAARAQPPILKREFFGGSRHDPAMDPNWAIIVPLYNERDNVVDLVAEIDRVLSPLRLSFGLVLVDDGSTDGTWERIQAAAKTCRRVLGLRHAVNAGQSAAVWTGIHATSAPYLATLDGDGQNDPRDLSRLIEAVRSGQADFVCGVRERRCDAWVRRQSSWAARMARRWVLGSEMRDTGCALRAWRREALERVLPFHGFHRLLPVLVQAEGIRCLELPVSHRPRLAGVSKYGVWNRLGRGLHDLIGIRWYLKRRLRPVAIAARHSNDATPAGGTGSGAGLDSDETG
jgi:dolichol-phosphate mannosyltransferase